MLFSRINLHCFQSDNCVFFIYILYTFLPLECAPQELYYIRHAHVYTHYFSTERDGVQTQFTSRTYRSLHDWYRHEFRHRAHPTFGRCRPRHQQGKQSTTTHIQARSITQGWQGEFEGSPRTIRTAAGYTTLDSSYTPFLQPIWCETQIFRHMDT